MISGYLLNHVGFDTKCCIAYVIYAVCVTDCINTVVCEYYCNYEISFNCFVTFFFFVLLNLLLRLTYNYALLKENMYVYITQMER